MATARELLTWPSSPATNFASAGKDLAALVGGKRIILASNRGPVQYSLDLNGDLVAHRGQGGLVTALTALLRHANVSWVASSMSAADREASRRFEESPELRLMDESLRLRLVNVPPQAYQRHYEVFSNPLLWLLQHSLAGELIQRPASLIEESWRWGYVPVNHAVALAVLDEMQQPDTIPWVFVHDYHLYLAGHFIRQKAPHAFLQHFTHIPWPAPGEGLRHLGPIWQEILQGLLANDIVGFQTERHAVNFLNDCQDSLVDTEVDFPSGRVFYRGRSACVRSYPISVDVQAIREEADSIEFATHRRKLKALCSEFVVVKVERVDPTKNTVFSLQAYRRFLEQHPELAGRVTMLAFLVPSRSNIPEYRLFSQRVMQEVDSINAQFGNSEHLPIHAFYENNYVQALAGMSLYDALLVNPVADGMNLVAKEGPVVNRKDGVLVLSETAGAHEQLKTGVLSVRPDDMEGTAEAIYQALRMSPSDRQWRAALLRSSIERADLTDWLSRQMRDAHQLAGECIGRGRAFPLRAHGILGQATLSL